MRRPAGTYVPWLHVRPFRAAYTNPHRPPTRILHLSFELSLSNTDPLRAIAADELALPAHLEELVFMQESFVWSGPLPFPAGRPLSTRAAACAPHGHVRCGQGRVGAQPRCVDADYFDYGWIRRCGTWC
ncbi:hypothetical protein C8R44DRAFT_774480 [Mycena epipterygia]|nr:hypothetical protein C8R44DRAFT_774480 [Mycena epipterygia]